MEASPATVALQRNDTRSMERNLNAMSHAPTNDGQAGHELESSLAVRHSQHPSLHGEVAIRSTHHYTAKSPFAAPIITRRSRYSQHPSLHGEVAIREVAPYFLLSLHLFQNLYSVAITLLDACSVGFLGGDT
jgi:hypothetical protein